MADNILKSLATKIKTKEEQVVKKEKILEFRKSELEKELKSESQAEAEVSALQKTIRQLEDELESTETRLTEATAKLEEASKAADESDRSRRALENDNKLNEGKKSILTKQIDDYIKLTKEAESECAEASRKLTITEVELERSESRLESAESEIKQLQESHVDPSVNQRSIAFKESKAAQREEAYEENIRDLTERLKAIIEQRRCEEERLKELEDKLNEAEQRIARAMEEEKAKETEMFDIENELVAAKEKYKNLSEELDSTFAELTGN